LPPPPLSLPLPPPPSLSLPSLPPLPYFTRKSIPLPPDFIDIDDTCLHQMEHSLTADGDEEDDYQNPTDTLIE
jgi:hypothetical protein